MAASGDSRGVRGRPQLSDYLFFILLSLGAAYALYAYSEYMDVYEKGILISAVPLLAWMGWLWRPLRTIMVLTGATALFAIWLYSVDGNLLNGDIAKSEQVFLLRYLLSSQSAILWMCALFVLATVCYWIGFASTTAAWVGSAMTWGAVYAGITGMLVRWREGHLLGPDIGHIPVSNLLRSFRHVCADYGLVLPVLRASLCNQSLGWLCAVGDHLIRCLFVMVFLHTRCASDSTLGASVEKLVDENSCPR